MSSPAAKSPYAGYRALSASWSLAGTKRLGQNDEMTSEPATYPGYRFPAEIIGYAVWHCQVVRVMDAFDRAA